MGRKLIADQHLKEHQTVVLDEMFPNPEIVKVFKFKIVANCPLLYEEADTRIILHTLTVTKQFWYKMPYNDPVI